MFYALNEQLI